MPYYDDMPDLSGWNPVAEFRAIEAALLLSGIDPWDHEDFVRGRRALMHSRVKQFKSMERAIVTAISQGTLAARAVVSLFTDNGDNYTQNFDLVNHSWADIDTFQTMITRPSLFAWVAKARIDYARPRPAPKPMVTAPPWTPELSEVLRDIGEDSDRTDTITPEAVRPLLIENKPSFLDPDNEMSPVELRAAADCWEAITVDGDPSKQGKAILAVAKEWLQNNRSKYGDLSGEAIERIAKVVNWNKKGGAPRTPDKPTHPANPHKS
ncbi:hypothetical protein L519_4810 [Bordetella bronchiseptica MBORD678]|uniref:hypothetical protein n=1 Tax=Bordetella bronchiseptica TaxID=518 RepID=UPI0004A06BD6|nr:hypothetical protein [Bordetella bronchiseptica]KDD84036.1 hypothetical protein L519_4810 [Bordetella bronchiseptica MBORD678]